MEKFIGGIVSLFIKLPFVRNKFDKNSYKVIELYKNSGFDYIYSKIRFWDGPFLEIERLVPESGVVVDLGCGEGILTNYLALSSSKRNLIGIDIDKSRIKEANRGVKNVKFVKGDVVDYKLPKCDCIVVSHVFHHLLSYNDQDILVENISRRLEKGGKLIVAEIDRGVSLKYILGWFVDVIVVPILFEKRLSNINLYYRSQKEWFRLFRERGFKASIEKCLPGRPFPDIIIQAIKE